VAAAAYFAGCQTSLHENQTVTKTAFLCRPLALLLALGLLQTATAEILVWDFVMDEQQVRNSGFGDGSTDSPATGSAVFTYNMLTNEFGYSVTWDGLLGELTKLHIHGPATPNMSNPQHLWEIFGPPDIPPGVNLQSDTWTDSVQLTTLVQPGFPDLSPSQIIDIMSQGLAYVNVHTTVFGMGEIRGNMGLPTVVPEPAAVWLAIAGGAALAVARRTRGASPR
jgi:hypothetical protein